MIINDITKMECEYFSSRMRRTLHKIKEPWFQLNVKKKRGYNIVHVKEKGNASNKKKERGMGGLTS